MTRVEQDDEGAWAAEKRDFVADSRDDTADLREAFADQRDAAAAAREMLVEAREAQLVAWQALLEARAVELGLMLDSPQGTLDATPGDERDRDEAARVQAEGRRDQAKADRDMAEKRRAEGRTTLLAVTFASIAEHLYQAGTSDEVLTRIAEAAVATVAGSTMASVTMRDGPTLRTGASTDQAAAEVDQAQYDAGEGPSLDAFIAALVDAPAFPDDRWPTLGSAPEGHGVHSALSYRLASSIDRGAAALNVYSSDPAAFSQVAQEIGYILAAHASLAARAVDERTSLQEVGHQLQTALLSRDVIGQAKGILMERLKTTPDDAFDILRRASQQLNVKLREVARLLAETGHVDPDDLHQT